MPKPKDFTESAVNLCNPPELKELLEKLATEKETMQKLTDELHASNTELAQKIVDQQSAVSDIEQLIRETVEEKGSYQDTEAERYAVKYKRKTAAYGNVEAFKKKFPKFAELCITESIDVNALKGQIKGKLITEEDLEKAGVLTYDESFAFYVR